MKERLVDEEDGFSLPEMMTTTVIMIVVLFALYSVFDTSIRIFRFGNDKIEAAENARIGLQKMEREIRAAYPVNGPYSTDTFRYRFFNANGATSSPPQNWPAATQITFGNETGSPGDGSIRCGSPCEYITYKLTSMVTAANPNGLCTTASAPCTLSRVNAVTSAGEGAPVVEFVKPNGLQFTYLKANGTEVSAGDLCPTAEQPTRLCTTQDIAQVRIMLLIGKNGRSQELTTVVDLRNRGTI